VQWLKHDLPLADVAVPRAGSLTSKCNQSLEDIAEPKRDVLLHKVYQTFRHEVLSS
jgi:hypothetical protein